ncbi:hypothetical protein [Sporichthya sp.]|uniref:hypothetical protein n=1 Tax=Sporichthya sp. TaxID=65475 RepID=UPI0018059A57|nr:hypothetical protein [Sporichthya sp.]MBA3745860.1 hypothetical protein [Sporichthya sp.]
MSTPLRTFTGQIDGASAEVTVHVDRIEWARQSGAQVIAVQAIGSVTSKRRGLTNATVSVLAAGSAFDFRVARAEASVIADLLRSLVQGSHPAQRPAPLIPPFPAVASPGAVIPAQSTVADVPDPAVGFSR